MCKFLLRAFVASVLGVLVVGCDPVIEGDKPFQMYVQKFKPGDLVTMKVDGRKAIVVSVTFCEKEAGDAFPSCEYLVRFPTSGVVRTDTHVAKEDGAYATLVVYDYEITRK